MAEKNFMKNEEDDARKWRLSGVKWTDQADSLQPKPSPGIIPPSLCCSWKKMLLVELLCVTCAVHWSALSFIYKDTETEMWRVVLISKRAFFFFFIFCGQGTRFDTWKACLVIASVGHMHRKVFDFFQQKTLFSMGTYASLGLEATHCWDGCLYDTMYMACLVAH